MTIPTETIPEWSDLNRVDWKRLHHAYGDASDVPSLLMDMISAEQTENHTGWNNFWGCVNHQGDFYDSTVATIPFLVRALTNTVLPNCKLLRLLCKEQQNCTDMLSTGLDQTTMIQRQAFLSNVDDMLLTTIERLRCACCSLQQVQWPNIGISRRQDSHAKESH